MASDIVVHIVDDEEPVRNSLAFLLGAAGFAVRTHASAMAFLQVSSSIRNGCLVTDLRMPDMDGVELLRELRSRDEMLPAIVVTGHGDVQMAVAAMKTGAMDFIEKPFDDDVLITAIQRAVDAAGSEQDAVEMEQKVQARLDSLNRRELQVLKRVVDGHANKVIAQDLGISPRTVEVYRAGLMSKMQAKGLAELVRMVLGIDLSRLRERDDD